MSSLLTLYESHVEPATKSASRRQGPWLVACRLLALSVLSAGGLLVFPQASQAQKICPKALAQPKATDTCPNDTGWITVTPDGWDTLHATPSTSVRSAYFDVENGGTSETYNLSCSSSAPVACVGVEPSTLTMSAWQSSQVRVDFTAGSLGEGTVTLTASNSLRNDSGYYPVKVVDPSLLVAPSVVDLSQNNDLHWAKERCLTFAVGRGLVQCGDYVLVHSLPSFRTFNRDRAPVLIYNSGTAEVRPIVHANVTFPASGILPDEFSVALFFNGSPTATREAFYAVWGFDESVDETRRMSVVMMGDAVSTGVYPYVLEARAWYTGESKGRAASGKMIVVNRRSSPYGVGWWLAGLERLYLQGNGDALVVLGDGSAKLFTKATDSTFAAPRGEYSRLQANSNEGGWDRVLRGGGRVHFDIAGRHNYTDDPDGNRTQFFYDPSIERIDSIRINPTQVAWRLYYGADGVVDSIIDPAVRKTWFTKSGGRLTKLHYPDGNYKSLAYGAGRYAPSNVYDERGYGDAITYDRMSRPSQIQVPPPSGVGNPYFSLRLAEVHGVDTLNTSPRSGIGAVRPDAPADTFVEPRGNKTVFRTNIFEEPIYVRDALGQETWITRNASSEPERVRHPNGRVVRLTWDDGRLLQFWDSTYAADHGLAGQAKVNFFYEDASCPHDLTRMERSVTATEVLATSYTYDAPANPFRGCRLRTATDERGHVTEFDYLADGRLRAIAEKDVPSGPAATLRDIQTTLAYWPTTDMNPGARGNLHQVTGLHPSLSKRDGYPSTTDTLVTTTFYYDGYGNLSRRVDPAGHNIWQEFTVRNFLRQTIVQVYTDPDSIQYDTFYEFEYDPVGNRTHVYTPYWRKHAPPGTSRRFTYNPWNLVEKELAETNDSTVYTYDLAGNVASVRNPNGHVVTFRYDALNRVTLKAVPAATQPYGDEGLSEVPTRTIPADTIRWHYNSAGQVDTFRTRTDYVARSYFLDGTVRTERQTIAGRIYDLSYGYDLAGRRTLLNHPTNFDSVFGTQQTTYVYSGPDLQSLTNPIGEVTQFNWDPMGRLALMVHDNGVRTRRWYNDAGNLDSISVISPTYYIKYSSSDYVADASADTIVYLTRHRYDKDGLIIIEWEAHDARIYRNAVAYDAAHRVELVQRLFLGCHYTMGDVVPQQYCGADFYPTRLESSHEDQGYDARGNQTIDDQHWNVWERSDCCPYLYYGDPLYPLAGSKGVNRYDLYYNSRSQHELTDLLEKWPDGSTASTGEDAFQLTQKFDRAGNLRRRIELPHRPQETFDGFPPVDTFFHYYTVADRLAKSITHYDRDRASCVHWAETDYEYDGFGRRIRKFVSITAWLDPDINPGCADYAYKDIIHEYIYDGDDLLYERITEAWGTETDPTDYWKTEVIEVLYTRGPSGEAISRRVPQAKPRINGFTGELIAPKSMFYHLNRQNTPAAATDILAHRFTLPELTVATWVFGGGIPMAGGPPWVYWFNSFMFMWRPAVSGENAVSFHGQPYDPETGFHYFRNRYYDGRSGRFTQEDPIGLAGGLNLYAYANNNPVMYTDPFGLCPPADDNFADCAPGTSEWYAHRIATGQGSRLVNEVGGVLATCGESLLCQGVLLVASLGSSAATSAAGRGALAASEATTTATLASQVATASATGSKLAGAVGRITGFTKHGINQVINRGVRPENILQAVKNANPVRLVDKAGRVSFRYVGEKATVILNEAGKVITAW